MIRRSIALENCVLPGVRSLEDVEFATLDWVAWYNTHRLLTQLGYVPPVEYEDHYYRHHPTHAMGARVN